MSIQKQKTTDELISSFKKMNKQARERHAEIKGFTSASNYLGFLLKKDSKSIIKTTTKKKKVKTLPLVHVVDILDVSGSMDSGGSWTRSPKPYIDSKLYHALNAINMGVKELVKETKVKYKHTFVTFNAKTDIIHMNVPVENVSNLTAKANGGTSMFDAICSTLNSLKKTSVESTKILVNIYTDGGENSSRLYSRTQTSEIISECQENNFTVTFIGTDADTKFVVDNLSIDVTNTLSYNGTAEGLKSAMFTNSLSRTAFASKVSKGEDVSSGYYKSIKN